MLLNYLKLSFRLMARNPFFTLINILGLGIGFASFFALWDFSTHQLQADRFHKDFERIARIGYSWSWSDKGDRWDNSITGFCKSDIPLRASEDFAEIEDFTRIHTQPFFSASPGGLVPHGQEVTLTTVGLSEDLKFKEDHIIYADPNLFNFFSIPLIHGSADHVLKEAGSVVLSQSQSVKYFGQRDPVGQLLELNDSTTLRVTGVFEDLPSNTHLNFNTVISNQPYRQVWATAINGPTFNYIKIKEGTSFQGIEAKINTRMGEYAAALLQRLSNTRIEVHIQPLKDIFFTKFPFDEFSARSKPLLVTFAVVSIVFLTMAWVNYINLWVARNKLREKELATRKIIGAQSKDLLFQFLTESAILNLLAFFLAVTLLQFGRAPLKQIFDIPINNFWELDGATIGFFALMFLCSITITGLYPALASSRNSLSLIRQSTKPDQKSLFSSALVITQYTAAIALILWSSIIYFQLNFVLQHDVGFDRDNVLVVKVPSTANAASRLDALVNRIASNASVEKIAYGVGTPEKGIAGRNTRILGNTTQIGFDWNGVNETYLDLFGLKIIAGRNFVPNDRHDALLISHIAVQRWGFKNPDDAVGTRLEILTSEAVGTWLTMEVIGVFEDYRNMPFFATDEVTTDLKNEYQSRGKMFTYKTFGFNDFELEKLAVKIKSGSMERTIASVEEAYKAVFPGTVFDWTFLDDNVKQAYVDEQTTRNQVLLFMLLAILIACLGFQGMIAHKVTSRTKELGIRKVLGAGVAHISKIILRPSMGQFAIASIIGCPLAWYLGRQYLEKFSERVELHWWHFAFPVILLIAIMLGTISMVILKAVRTNPIEAIKYE